MTSTVTVVGAGWAGLACALELTTRGYKVRLLEAAPRAGGRARGLPPPRQTLDNGQHLLLGAYKEVLRLLNEVDVDPAKAFLRHPLQLWQYDGQGRYGLAASAWLPAPLHILLPLLRFHGLRLGQRWRLIRFLLWCHRRGFRLPQDRPLQDLLREHGQDQRTIALFWEPLCLAALNTPIAEASAQLLLNTLRDSVAEGKQDSEMLLPRCSLDELFVAPTLKALTQRDVDIGLGSRVTELHFNAGENLVTAVQLASGEQLAVERLVLATPATVTAQLLGHHPTLQPLAQQIQSLEHYPVCTVYLRYPTDTRLPAPMLGLLNGPGQWLFDGSHTGQPGRLAMSISGPGPHMDLDSAALGQAVAAQIAHQFPQLPQAEDIYVLREKRATFAARAGVQALRPEITTPCANLFLAADYVRHDYPATLEAAAQIGVQCARIIAAQSETTA